MPLNDLQKHEASAYRGDVKTLVWLFQNDLPEDNGMVLLLLTLVGKCKIICVSVCYAFRLLKLGEIKNEDFVEFLSIAARNGSTEAEILEYMKVKWNIFDFHKIVEDLIIRIHCEIIFMFF